MSRDFRTTVEELYEEESALLRELQETRDAIEKEKKREAMDRYVKVACPACLGQGEVVLGGADILSDPPREEICFDCYGDGYLLARRFEGLLLHDMDYNQVFI